MKLFENYTNSLEDILSRKSGKRPSLLSTAALDKALLNKAQANEVGLVKQPTELEKKVLFKFDYTPLCELYGVPKYSINEPTIGPHPDFSYLQHDQIEKHYAVSVFIDIKNSTELIKQYDLQTIRLFKDSILTLAIYVCNFFGGHIQRLQGDGIFVYFVRKDLDPHDAIISSLNACSLFAYYIEFQLAKLFKKVGANPLKVRIGIDYGDSDNVIWSYYGLEFCRELTTTSLHTDLAAKLQADADSNGIMVGDNIISSFDFQGHLKSCDLKDQFIFNNYRKWNFNWINYLSTFNFFKKDSEKNLLIDTRTIKLKCFISENENSEKIEYNQNLYSVPKGYSIRFELFENGHPYQKKDFEKIVWRIYNYGKEAENAKAKFHDLEKIFVDKNFAITSAAYLGHHYIECHIKRPNINSVRLKFPVFVR